MTESTRCAVCSKIVTEEELSEWISGVTENGMEMGFYTRNAFQVIPNRQLECMAEAEDEIMVPVICADCQKPTMSALGWVQISIDDLEPFENRWDLLKAPWLADELVQQGFVKSEAWSDDDTSGFVHPDGRFLSVNFQRGFWACWSAVPTTKNRLIVSSETLDGLEEYLVKQMATKKLPPNMDKDSQELFTKHFDRVEIETLTSDADGEGEMVSISPIWKGVDRPNVGGWIIGKPGRRTDLLVERMRYCLESGIAFKKLKLAKDVNNETYIQAEALIHRDYENDLKQLGF